MKTQQRLVVLPYPSKKQFAQEANRDDCDSYPAIHVDINHNDWNTVSLYGLLEHEWPLSNLTKHWRSYIWKKKGTDIGLWIMKASDLTLNERSSDEMCKSKYRFFTPQIQVWWHDYGPQDYQMWIDWCKHILKRKARYAGSKNTIYNPFEGLEMQVRVEFHD